MGKYFLILCFCISCASKKEPGVSRVDNAGFEKLPMELHSLTGQREGYEANAELRYVDTRARDTLAIRFTLEPGVPTKFVSGEYRWKTQSGEVTCLSVDFFGGQGGVPSLGANFTFVTREGEKYIVVLPTTEMKSKK